MATEPTRVSWWNPISWFRRPRLEVDGPTPSSPPRPQLRPPRPGPLELRLLDQHPHIGRETSVPAILRAHDAAEGGFPANFISVGRDRLKADGHLRSAVDQRRDSVGRKGWVVLPGGENEVDMAAARALESHLRRARGFRSALKHHAMTFWHGYALSEIHWEFIDGLFVPAAFGNPLPHWFVFDGADQPRWSPPWRQQGLLGDELRAGGWWYSRVEGDRAAVAGVAVTGILWSHLKTLGFRDWIRLMTRFGLPYVYGQYRAGDEDDPNASDDDIAKLKTAVQSLGSDGWAVFSDAASIEIAEITSRGGGAGEIHNAIIQLCDQIVSKLITGATTLAQTSGSTGSFAQSRVHADRGFEIVAGDAEDLADSFEASVGEQFVTYNAATFPGAQPPRLKIHLVKDQSPTSRAGVFKTAVEMGVPVSIQQVRTELQLKPPANNGDILRLPDGAPAEEESNGQDPED